MLKIVGENVIRLGGATFDYELEDGTLLHENEWNGEDYTADGTAYKPIYAEQENKNGGYDIVGFERR